MIWDEGSNLVWARCSLGQKWNGKACAGLANKYSFDDAAKAASAFNRAGGLGGFTDWEVPSIAQLEGLRLCTRYFTATLVQIPGPHQVSKECNDDSRRPTINPVAFPNTDSYFYWSSSPYVGNSGDAWGVNFLSGYFFNGRDGGNHVRLVRASQLLDGEAALVFPKELEEPSQADWARAEQWVKAQDAAREANEKAEEKVKLQKTLSAGAQGLYLQAAKKVRSGDASDATKLYKLIIQHFPKDPLAVKAADQLTAMERSSQERAAANRAAEAQRQADRNASNRASCFSSVNSCTARCRASGMTYGAVQDCVSGCQRSCD